MSTWLSVVAVYPATGHADAVDERLSSPATILQKTHEGSVVRDILEVEKAREMEVRRWSADSLGVVERKGSDATCFRPPRTTGTDSTL